MKRKNKEKIQDLLENSINTDFEYENFLSDKENPLFIVYRYLAYLVRFEKDKESKTTRKYQKSWKISIFQRQR